MQVPDVVLTDTYRLIDLDGGIIPSGRYVWRGPAGVPVFAFENCRDIRCENVDVVVETATQAVFLVERTKTGGGVIPSTMHLWRNVRIYGGFNATFGFWYRATIDENNEHARLDGVSVYQCQCAFKAQGQQSKEHLFTHCRFESGLTAIAVASGFQMIGGTIADFEEAVILEQVGEPVKLQGVGIETCMRLLETAGPTTAAQPITLDAIRYEADQLHADGDAVKLRHPGPLRITGSRLGGGNQRIPRIYLGGFGEQSVELCGNVFGSFGAHEVCPIRAQDPANARIGWGRNNYQRHANDPQNVDARTAWASKYYV